MERRFFRHRFFGNDNHALPGTYEVVFVSNSLFLTIRGGKVLIHSSEGCLLLLERYFFFFELIDTPPYRNVFFSKGNHGGQKKKKYHNRYKRPEESPNREPLPYRIFL